jgi:uncharacterized membrane protein (DUF485 family)
MSSSQWILVFVIVSAVLTTLLMRWRGVPLIELWEAETFDWQMARKVILTMFVITAIAQAFAAMPFVKANFEWQGVPGLLWALGAFYVYLWFRCIWLVARDKKT